jgi:CMP-N,N'-diacetyllegionaminic acid synthase
MVIPARRGSTRVPGKNTRLLAGRPLWTYTERVAKTSGLGPVYICSNEIRVPDGTTLAVGRTEESETSEAPDILWLRDFVTLNLPSTVRAVMILRPTSPFRTVEMLQRAWTQFQSSGADSLRSVEAAREHPGKMWTIDGAFMTPAIIGTTDGVPWHSSPTQILPPYYKQNASLELVWTRVVRDQHSLSGQTVAPFFTQGYEGFDINTEADFTEAERLIATGAVCV